MLHKAWNSKGEMPYRFPRSSVKFQGHTVQSITDFDPNWAFPDYRSVAAFKSLRFALFNMIWFLTWVSHSVSVQVYFLSAWCLGYLIDCRGSWSAPVHACGGSLRGWEFSWKANHSTWSQWEVAIVLKCGDLRSGAPCTHLSYPILSFPYLSFPYLSFLFLSFPFLSFWQGRGVRVS